MSYKDVIDAMRNILSEKSYAQIPQVSLFIDITVRCNSIRCVRVFPRVPIDLCLSLLFLNLKSFQILFVDCISHQTIALVNKLSSSNLIDVDTPFDFTPPEATGTKRALLIGINYVGAESGVLSGCHNDVHNMVEYIRDVHGFAEENITVLLDDGEHTSPTYENMVNAYRTIVDQAEPGDALFCHYSGHGCGIKDDESEESDGKDEALVPVDYLENGVIRDDDLFEILIKPLKDDVHLMCIMDCCHSGSILDLPYIYKASGEFQEMGIAQNFKFGKLMKKFGQELVDNLAEE